MVHRFTIGCTLGHRALTSTTANSDTVDDIPLLGLVVYELCLDEWDVVRDGEKTVGDMASNGHPGEIDSHLTASSSIALASTCSHPCWLMLIAQQPERKVFFSDS